MFRQFQAPPGQAAWMYTAYELSHATFAPLRHFARNADSVFNSASSPFAGLPMGRAVHAGWRVVDELTKRYAKPEFGIESVSVGGVDAPVTERAVMSRPFARLVHFDKGLAGRLEQPRVLLIAPMSGHFATLLRGTVRAMLPDHDLYITDWADARFVPLGEGRFDLHRYVDYLMAFIRFLGPDLHVIAVCQPSVPALAATALLAEEHDPAAPASLTLMAGPIDTSEQPTAVNEYAESRELEWFRRHVVTYVPFPHAGACRAVYPGFLQLAGFMGMNVDSHLKAYQSYFENLIRGDADSTEQHRRFYDEYLAVMDLTAEFFMQTVDVVFQRRLLANREFEHRGRRVDCSAIRDTVLMTIEGELDDICGLGQTEAAHSLCDGLSASQRFHYVQPGVGHYGVFNGTRWRTEIQPRIAQMISSTQAAKRADR